MRQDKRTLQQWKDLAERYFEAETTSAEEHELAQFLATSASQDKEFDELRAVMSYMAAGRNYCRTRRRRNTIVYAAAAIITGILFTVTAWQFSERRNICVAYIYGERCIDKETVLTEAMKSIEKVRPGSQEENILHNQLSDIFQTLEENDTLSTTN